jgi:PASTA domain-containing protein
MTSAAAWLGRKRVAFVPLFRSHAAPPDLIPTEWEAAIRRRVLFDPRREANGADRSLRAWLRAASSGRADIDPVVLPMQTIDKQAVEATELEGTLGSQLRAQGMDAAVLVMLGQRPSGTNSGFWSRVVMAESNGVWLMELIHGLTGFKDLYHFNNDVDPAARSIGSFDEMAASSQTHPTAFTKNELGWLDAAAIRLHAGLSGEYELQHVSLSQPPAGDRVAALRIGDGFPYVMVEARKMTDQFEAGMPGTSDPQEIGIASEGVIAYRVQTRNATIQEREGHKKPLYLMTPTALQPGQSLLLDDEVTLTVTSARADGFAIRVEISKTVVPDVRQEFAADAASIVHAAGLVAKFTGPNHTHSWVFSQSPVAGHEVAKGTVVKMVLRDGPLP